MNISFNALIGAPAAPTDGSEESDDGAFEELLHSFDLGEHALGAQPQAQAESNAGEDAPAEAPADVAALEASSVWIAAAPNPAAQAVSEATQASPGEPSSEPAPGNATLEGDADAGASPGASAGTTAPVNAGAAPSPAAPSPASMPASPPPPAPVLVDHADQIQTAVDSLRPFPEGGASVEVVLEDLGHVEIRVEPRSGGATRVTIAAADVDAAARLESERGALSTLLTESAPEVSIAVEIQTLAALPARPVAPWVARRRREPRPKPEAEAPAPRRRPTDGLVDVVA